MKKLALHNVDKFCFRPVTSENSPNIICLMITYRVYQFRWLSLNQIRESRYHHISKEPKIWSNNTILQLHQEPTKMHAGMEYWQKPELIKKPQIYLVTTWQRKSTSSKSVPKVAKTKKPIREDRWTIGKKSLITAPY